MTNEFQPTASFEDQRIAHVYAEALMNATEKANAIDEVKGELQELVENVFGTQRDFEALLASGIISKENKADAIKAVFENKASETFFNFLMVLAEHDRLYLLRAIHLEFNRLNDRRQHRIPVQVTSAVALNEEQTNRLTEDLRGRFELDPILHTVVDPAILGGLIIRVGDWVFDRSVRSQINNIRKQLLARGSYVIQSGRDRFSN